jgi:hypothetical protein
VAIVLIIPVTAVLIVPGFPVDHKVVLEQSSINAASFVSSLPKLIKDGLLVVVAVTIRWSSLDKGLGKPVFVQLGHSSDVDVGLITHVSSCNCNVYADSNDTNHEENDACKGALCTRFAAAADTAALI